MENSHHNSGLLNLKSCHTPFLVKSSVLNQLKVTFSLLVPFFVNRRMRENCIVHIYPYECTWARSFGSFCVQVSNVMTALLSDNKLHPITA